MKKNKIIITTISLFFVVLTGIYFFYQKQILFKNNAVKVITGLLDKQKEVDQTIKSALENKEYTLDNPKIILNPYEISPLTAIIIFSTEEEVIVNLTINKGDSISFEANQNHALPIYGLKADYQNEIVISINNNEKIIQIKTEAIPERYKDMEVVKKEASINNDLYLVTSPMGDAAAAYDKNGAIRWYLTENYYFTPKVLENGHLILGNGEIRDKYGSSTGFIEIDLLGKIHNYYRFPQGYHHYLSPLENSYLFASNNLEYNRYFDNIVEISKDGNIINTWDLFNIIEQIDSEFAQSLDEIWAWINSVYYDKASNSLIISLRGRNSVISIDYTSSKLNWIFGDKKFWSDKFASYILETDSNTSVPLGQHSAFITSDGYLGLFNNGFDASSYDKTVSCNELKNNNSSVNLYQINKKEIKQIWHYNPDDKFFSYALSSFGILENKNKLILSGWEINYQENCHNTNDLPIQAHIIELDKNDNLIFEGIIPQGKFSAIKINLYNNNTKKINLNTLNIYNQINQEQSHPSKIDLSKTQKTSISYTVTSNKFEINGLYPKASEIKLVFVSEQEKSLEFLIKEKNSQIMYPLMLNNMKGKYHLFLIENNNYLDTGIILDF